jgi:iron complex transport system substrate-binding protein
MRGSGFCVVFASLAAGAASGDPATRVVSLDYCADQYVLELLPRDRILALSPDAEADYSYHRERAAGLDKVRPVAEDVIALEPGLVVRSYGGGPQALAFFERAGIPVVQVPYANDLDDVRAATRAVAGKLGVHDEGEALVAAMNARLANVEPAAPGRSALYVTSGGATAGPGTLVHEMLLSAGLENFEARPGWHVVPLEHLAYDGPDLVVASFFDGSAELTAYWSAMRHPVARRQLEGSRSLSLPGSWTACGAWFVLDAVEALAAAR